MTTCLIDQTLATALLTEPIARGWADAGDQVDLVPNLTAEMVAERGAAALVNSVDAAYLADRYAIVTDLAFVSHHHGAIAVWTPTRPDEIDHAIAGLNDVSRTAEAVARATITRFYGFQVTGWDRTGVSGDITIHEGLSALQPPSRGHMGDLVRAWFILSGFPLPTHLLVVPRELATNAPDEVDDLVTRLQAALATGIERRREIRRNLADDHGLDRELLSNFHADQTTKASKTVRKAWLDLIRRTSRAMKHPSLDDLMIISASGERSEE